jgi:hypothetical protein
MVTDITVRRPPAVPTKLCATPPPTPGAAAPETTTANVVPVHTATLHSLSCIHLASPDKQEKVGKGSASWRSFSAVQQGQGANRPTLFFPSTVLGNQQDSIRPTTLAKPNGYSWLNHGSTPPFTNAASTTSLPSGLEEFGFPTRTPSGAHALFYIRGNVPGRCDAGKIWDQVYTKFLLDYGLQQSLVDRCMFYLRVEAKD